MKNPWLDRHEGLKLLVENKLPTPDEVHDLLKEIDRLRGVSAYLASCHAATAESEGMTASASRSKKERMMGICVNAVQFLSGYPAESYGTSSKDMVAAALDRCQRAADDIKSALDKKPKRAP